MAVVETERRAVKARLGTASCLALTEEAYERGVRGACESRIEAASGIFAIPSAE